MITKTEKDPIVNGHKFRLCYVEEIPKTYEDYDEETKAMVESPEYQEYKRLKNIWYNDWFKEHHSMSSTDSENWDFEHGYRWRFNWKEYPNPDYQAGFTHYLFFTDNFEEQWGDDWDDAPYEHNAEIPYDDESNIIRIAVKLDYTEEEYEQNKFLTNFNIALPKDYGYGNSPFSVDIINAGAIPWVFMYIYRRKGIPLIAASLMGGDTILEVFGKIDNFRILLNGLK